MDEIVGQSVVDQEPNCWIEVRTFDAEGTPVPLTDGPATIGQPVQIYAVSPSAPILSVAFNFDMTAVVETFLASEASGGPVPYDPAGLVVNPLMLCPIKAGTLVFTCTVTTRYGPQVISLSLAVSAPTVTGLSAETGDPKVWVDGQQRAWLQFLGPNNSAGIVITATVSGTQALGGTLAFIQIAQNARWLTRAN